MTGAEIAWLGVVVVLGLMMWGLWWFREDER